MLDGYSQDPPGREGQGGFSGEPLWSGEWGWPVPWSWSEHGLHPCESGVGEGGIIMATLSLVLEDRERHLNSERMVPPTISFSNPSFRVNCDSCPLMSPLSPNWGYI